MRGAAHNVALNMSTIHLDRHQHKRCIQLQQWNVGTHYDNGKIMNSCTIQRQFTRFK